MFTNYADVRRTIDSRFNTCQHLNSAGNWDCDKKVDGYKTNLCLIHYREKNGLTDDSELNSRIQEWREFFDKR